MCALLTFGRRDAIGTAIRLEFSVVTKVTFYYAIERTADFSGHGFGVIFLKRGKRLEDLLLLEITPLKSSNILWCTICHENITQLIRKTSNRVKVIKKNSTRAGVLGG